MNQKITSLIPAVKLNEPMKNHTTFKAGGPAEYFFEAQTTKDLVKAIKTARKLDLPFIVIGNGSNILVSDKGIKGLVIKNKASEIKLLSGKTTQSISQKIPPRFKSLEKETIELTKLEYDESKYEQVLVEIDSGATLPKAIFSLLNQGITGLEWFAGIPATIGGATYINLHGGSKYFSDYLVGAKILTEDNQLQSVSSDYFEFDYDDSELKTKADTVLSVTLKLLKGPKETALKIAKGWALKKSHQPQASAGCIFQNLSKKQQQELDLPTPSIGYLIDKVLNLKGKQLGKAIIAPKHAGFIENLGGAKASDITSLIKLMKDTAKAKLGLDLKLEIIPLGFDKEI